MTCQYQCKHLVGTVRTVCSRIVDPFRSLLVACTVFAQHHCRSIPSSGSVFYKHLDTIRRIFCVLLPSGIRLVYGSPPAAGTAPAAGRPLRVLVRVCVCISTRVELFYFIFVFKSGFSRKKSPSIQIPIHLLVFT